MSILTGSLEDYIEVIFILEKKIGYCRITDIAEYLEISKASANKAVNTLKSFGLLVHEKYGTISLTEKGLDTAKHVYQKHNVLMNFLTNILGISKEIAEKDACKIEHIISPETLQKISEHVYLKG